MIAHMACGPPRSERGVSSHQRAVAAAAVGRLARTLPRHLRAIGLLRELLGELCEARRVREHDRCLNGAAVARKLELQPLARRAVVEQLLVQHARQVRREDLRRVGQVEPTACAGVDDVAREREPLDALRVGDDEQHAAG